MPDDIISIGSASSVGLRLVRPKFMIAMIAAWMAAFSTGLGLGYTATALNSMKLTNRFHIKKEDESLIASLLPLGALLGGQIAGQSIEYLGRRKTIILISIPMVLSWILITYAPTVLYIFIARFILGFSCGSVTLVAPVYIGETCPSKYRGMFSSGFQLFVTFGIFISYVIGSYLPWSQLAAFSCLFPIIMLIFACLSVESPVWLLNRNRDTDFSNSLIFLFGYEVNDLDLQYGQSNFYDSIKLFSQKRILIPFGLSMMIMFYQQFSGINAILFYTNNIFESTGSSSSSLSTELIGFIQLISTLLSCFVTDKLGRRKLLMLSGGLMTLSLISFSSFYFIGNFMGKDYTREHYGWLPLVSLGVYVAVFSLGFGPLPWVLMSELQPIEIKGLGSGFATSLNWFCCFLLTYYFQSYVDLVGDAYTYLSFAFICVLSVISVYFLVPETKGKTMREIADLFKKEEEINLIRTATVSTNR